MLDLPAIVSTLFPRQTFHSLDAVTITGPFCKIRKVFTLQYRPRTMSEEMTARLSNVPTPDWEVVDTIPRNVNFPLGTVFRTMMIDFGCPSDDTVVVHRPPSAAAMSRASSGATSPTKSSPIRQLTKSASPRKVIISPVKKVLVNETPFQTKTHEADHLPTTDNDKLPTTDKAFSEDVPLKKTLLGTTAQAKKAPSSVPVAKASRAFPSQEASSSSSLSSSVPSTTPSLSSPKKPSSAKQPPGTPRSTAAKSMLPRPTPSGASSQLPSTEVVTKRTTATGAGRGGSSAKQQHQHPVDLVSTDEMDYTQFLQKLRANADLCDAAQGTDNDHHDGDDRHQERPTETLVGPRCDSKMDGPMVVEETTNTQAAPSSIMMMMMMADGHQKSSTSSFFPKEDGGGRAKGTLAHALAGATFQKDIAAAAIVDDGDEDLDGINAMIEDSEALVSSASRYV